MADAQNRFWDFHYVGFGSAPVAFGAFEVLLDVRAWEMVCSPVSSGTEAWCWFLENDPELRNGRKFSYHKYNRHEMQRQRDATMRDVRQAFHRGQWGRFVTFTPGGRYGRLRAMLYLRPDATGYFRGAYCDDWLDEEPIDFTWQPSELGLREARDILTAPLIGQESRWEAFCQRLLDEQIAPRFPDPLATREEFVDRPLRYLCGSEAELKQVTTWICHCHNDLDTLFANGPAKITYLARVEGEHCGLWTVNNYTLPVYSRYVTYSTHGQPPCPPTLKTLLGLAFDYNTFEGHSWHPRRGWEHVEACCRRGDWQVDSDWYSATVVRPSAHERAESLLCLFEWLEGKTAPETRQVLLNLNTE